jgi:hypothetical protein
LNKTKTNFTNLLTNYGYSLEIADWIWNWYNSSVTKELLHGKDKLDFGSAQNTALNNDYIAEIFNNCSFTESHNNKTHP